MNEVALQNGNGHTDLDRVMLTGDLSTITPKERIDYYLGVCRSVGLNPLTRPFDYIKLNGRTVLYAKRDAGDQLRKIHNVSIEIVDRKIANGLLTIHVRAKMPDGRHDEDVGVVPWPENIQGEAAANLLMKGITKAKRRATLSICGLGILDESEVTSVPGAELLEVDDAGEIRAAAPVEQQRPKRKKGFESCGVRKTSYAARNDGVTDKLLSEITTAINKANDVGAEALKEVWKQYESDLASLPSDWHDVVAAQYMDAMEANGEAVKVTLAGSKMPS
jgi:hypothetical protein